MLSEPLLTQALPLLWLLVQVLRVLVREDVDGLRIDLVLNLDAHIGNEFGSAAHCIEDSSLGSGSLAQGSPWKADMGCASAQRLSSEARAYRRTRAGTKTALDQVRACSD